VKLSVAYTHLSHHSGKSGYDQVVRYLAASPTARSRSATENGLRRKPA